MSSASHHPPPQTLTDASVGELVERIGSSDIAPGAGSAAAIVLALAAACVRKATLISLKHSPEDSRLQRASRQSDVLARRALAGADEDARGFRDLVKSRDKAGAAQELVRVGGRLEALAEALLELITEVRPAVVDSVAGDLIACEAFVRAARTVEQNNTRENRQAGDTGL